MTFRGVGQPVSAGAVSSTNRYLHQTDCVCDGRQLYHLDSDHPPVLYLCMLSTPAPYQLPAKEELLSQLQITPTTACMAVPLGSSRHSSGKLLLAATEGTHNYRFVHCHCVHRFRTECAAHRFSSSPMVTSNRRILYVAS